MKAYALLFDLFECWLEILEKLWKCTERRENFPLIVDFFGIKKQNETTILNEVQEKKLER